MAGETTTDPNGPLSWRDVYRAVEKSETSILAAINAAVSPLTQGHADHEERLRKIETGELPWVNRIAAQADMTHQEQGRRIGNVEERVAALEKSVNEFHSRERGIFATLSAGQKVIITVGAIVGMLVGLITLLTLFADVVRGMPV